MQQDVGEVDKLIIGPNKPHTICDVKNLFKLISDT